MPKIIQMPRRTKPENEGHPIHRSMILADPIEEIAIPQLHLAMQRYTPTAAVVVNDPSIKLVSVGELDGRARRI